MSQNAFSNNAGLNVEEIFAALAPAAQAALAVSGGADSMGMLHLFAAWRRANPLPSPERDLVLTVDHGLRPEAAAEAAFVVSSAEALGFEAHSLRLEGLAADSNVQAAAREARYQAMARAAAARGVRTLLTAHTMDDQAETFMMRLARGSGVEGLRCMLPARALFDIEIRRPLLQVPRAALRAFLRQREAVWVEDPGNKDETFERVAWRRQLKGLDDPAGFGAGAARSAQRLAAAYEALATWRDDFLSASTQALFPGVNYIEAAAYEALPRLMQVMVWQQVLAGSGREGAGLKAVEAAVDQFKGLALGRFAVAGCILSKLPRGRGYLCYREAGRSQPEPQMIELKAGARERVIFDTGLGLEIEAKAPLVLLLAAPCQAEAEIIARALKEAVRRGEGALGKGEDGKSLPPVSGGALINSLGHYDLTGILMGFAGLYGVSGASADGRGRLGDGRGPLLALPQLGARLERLAIDALAGLDSENGGLPGEWQHLSGLFDARPGC